MVQKPSALENVAKASDEGAPAGVSGAKKKDVAANAPGGCKQYFPATGITLSVPCE
jgi:hypothetical protein